MNQHLLFEAAGIRLGIPAELVVAVHENLLVQRVAGTCNWFLGLASIGNRLLPVTDAGAFYGNQTCQGAILEIEPTIGIAGLRVDSISRVSHAALEYSDTQPLQPLPSGRSLTLTGESVHDNEGADEHHIIDIKALLQSAEFLDIRAG